MAIDKDLTAETTDRYASGHGWQQNGSLPMKSDASKGEYRRESADCDKTAPASSQAKENRMELGEGGGGDGARHAAVAVPQPTSAGTGVRMDPTGLFRVPHRRGSPSMENGGGGGGGGGSYSHRQRAQLETPPGLIVRPYASVGSPAFSDISSLRWTPERGRHTASREKSRWAHYNGLPPIWDSSEAVAMGAAVPAAFAGRPTGALYHSPAASDVDLLVRPRNKRPLSISPIPSLDVDLNALIRTSPSSLVAYVVGSRGSSAASGSYGHLVPGGKTSPATAAAFHLPGAPPQLMRRMPPPPPSSQQRRQEADESPPPIVVKRGSGSGSGSGSESSGGGEQYTPPPLLTMPVGGAEEEKMVAEIEKSPVSVAVAPLEEEEGDEKTAVVSMETNCHWKECEKRFDSQEELVRHVNDDHIHGEKRDFVCYWSGCSRDQKPFKAQYMLVVHMRRHTGEKPHKCTFDGCAKAYSRLENLKTHLRSHTGEKPYGCEFPGCTKAFTNASDRAKHQNRTHSNLKPYACKNAGCPKRYTDPSSLRKHMKTCQLGVKKARGDESKDASSGLQTFPPQAPESAPRDESMLTVEKLQQFDQTQMVIEYGAQQLHTQQLHTQQHQQQRRGTVSTQLSYDDYVVAEPRRGSNFSQCSYASHGSGSVVPEPYHSPAPPSHHQQPVCARRSSGLSNASFAAVDSGIGSFDFDGTSRRSSNASTMQQQQQPPPAYLSPHVTHLQPQPQFTFPEPQQQQGPFPGSRRASDGVVSTAYRYPSEFKNAATMRRASDPTHHVQHGVRPLSRGSLRNQLTPNAPLPLPPSMRHLDSRPSLMVLDDTPNYDQPPYSRQQAVSPRSVPLHHPPAAAQMSPSYMEQGPRHGEKFFPQHGYVPRQQQHHQQQQFFPNDASVMMDPHAQSNMAINDMSSLLTNFAEENRQWGSYK